VSFFTLIKPIMLYLMPLIIAFIIFHEWKERGFRVVLFEMFILSIIPLIVLGSYISYANKTFGTPQISGGASMFAWKSREALAPGERILASMLAGGFGDFISDKFFTGYADNPEPFANVKQVFSEMVSLRNSGLSEGEIEDHFFDEAVNNIKQSPTGFILTSITGLLRLNTPVNQRGFPMTHFLTGTNPNLSDLQKISAILFVRLLWYFFLVTVLITLFKKSRNFREWGLIVIIILFWNFSHAALTHNESRYLLPIVPLYLLLFSSFLVPVLKRLRKYVKVMK